MCFLSISRSKHLIYYFYIETINTAPHTTFRLQPIHVSRRIPIWAIEDFLKMGMLVRAIQVLHLLIQNIAKMNVTFVWTGRTSAASTPTQVSLRLGKYVSSLSLNFSGARFSARLQSRAIRQSELKELMNEQVDYPTLIFETKRLPVWLTPYGGKYLRSERAENSEYATIDVQIGELIWNVCRHFNRHANFPLIICTVNPIRNRRDNQWWLARRGSTSMT